MYKQLPPHCKGSYCPKLWSCILHKLYFSCGCTTSTFIWMRLLWSSIVCSPYRHERDMWLVYQIIWWPYSLRSITKGIYFFLFLINNVSQAARREQPRSPILARLVSGIRSPDFTKDKDKDKSHDNHGEKSNCVPTFTRSPPLPPTCPPSPLRNQMRSDHKQLSIPAYMSCIILVIVYVYDIQLLFNWTEIWEKGLPCRVSACFNVTRLLCMLCVTALYLNQFISEERYEAFSCIPRA